MATIKAMVVAMQRQKMHSTDDGTVCDIVRYHLKEICKTLPNETPEGREFANIMFNFSGQKADAQVENVIAALGKKALDERDDLRAYPHLRQQIVDAINNRR